MEFGIGISINYLIMGSEGRREPFSTTIPDVEVEVTTTNSIWLGHFVMRMQYPRGIFRPYLDGLVGLNSLVTSTEIDDVDDFDEPIASSTNKSDIAFSYGGGAGLLFKVYEDEKEEEIKVILVDVGVRYIFGGEAEYLTEGSIRRVSGRVTYDVHQSKTDIITGHIGFVVRF